MTQFDRVIGTSAGKICYSNIEAQGYVQQKVLDAAELMWEDYKSAWLLLDYGADGTTEWESPDEKYLATVSPDGTISRSEKID